MNSRGSSWRARDEAATNSWEDLDVADDGTVEVLKDEQPEPDVAQRVADAITEEVASGRFEWRSVAEAAMAAYREALGCGDDDVLVPLPRAVVEEAPDDDQEAIEGLPDSLWCPGGGTYTAVGTVFRGSHIDCPVCGRSICANRTTGYIARHHRGASDV